MIKEKILTENPYEELWSYLSYFENYFNCYNYIKNNHKSSKKEIREYKASLLQYYIKQAHEYYNASLKVSLLTQPTLLYYGALCLSRALFLGKSGHPDNSNSHGLSEVDNNELKDITKFKIRINKKGTFSQLYKTIQTNYYPNFADISNTNWTLIDLLSMIPEIKDIYEDIYSKKSLVLKVNRFFDDDGTEYIKIYDDLLSKMQNKGVKDLFDSINGVKSYYLPYKRLNDSNFLLHKRNNVKGDITQKNLMGEEYLLLGIKQNRIIDLPDYGKVHLIVYINIPEMAVHLMILYLLSMLSRYHIKMWGEGSLELETADFFIIKNFLKVSTRKFPNLILNQLLDKEHIFTSELYKPKDLRIGKYKKQILEIIDERLEKDKEDKRMKKLMVESEHDLWD
jgi:hypothetical protein